MTVKEFERASQGARIYSVESLEIVKPAGKWVASISAQERRNYTPQAGFEEKLLAKLAAVKREDGGLIGMAMPERDHVLIGA